MPSAQDNAEATMEASSDNVIFAENSQENQEAWQGTQSFTVRQHAWEWGKENIGETTRGVEALMIWLGSKPSSKQEDTNALCAALTDDLKHIMLSQSRTFQNLDMKSQMDFASVTIVTITESTAESLISSTVDILRSKAIDKAAGAEREVIDITRAGIGRHGRDDYEVFHGSATESQKQVVLTAPPTEAARLWDGWGTALAPAWEPVLLAMKPLAGTYAANALAHGVAGLHVDGGRIPTAPGDYDHPGNTNETSDTSKVYGWAKSQGLVKQSPPNPLGRWPKNTLLSCACDGPGHEAACPVALLDGQSGFLQGRANKGPTKHSGNKNVYNGGWEITYGDGYVQDDGGASRFLYTAKASPSERGSGNTHPTVKPLALLDYLLRLTATPTGGIVLDPFAGSGSTLLAARALGRPSIGIELSEEYCAMAARRLAEPYDVPLLPATRLDAARNPGKTEAPPEAQGRLF